MYRSYGVSQPLPKATCIGPSAGCKSDHGSLVPEMRRGLVDGKTTTGAADDVRNSNAPTPAPSSRPRPAPATPVTTTREYRRFAMQHRGAGVEPDAHAFPHAVRRFVCGSTPVCLSPTSSRKLEFELWPSPRSPLVPPVQSQPAAPCRALRGPRLQAARLLPVAVGQPCQRSRLRRTPR